MMAAPILDAPFDPDGIPQELKDLPRWAPWVAVWNKKRGKFDKIPHNPRNSDHRVSTTKVDRWAPFDVALKAYQARPGKFAGLGLCVTGLEGFVIVDLDNVINEAGGCAPWASDVLLSLGSYAETSPSGKGLRIAVRGAVSEDWNNHDVGIEVYGGHTPRFLTFTGSPIYGDAVEDAPDGVLESMARQFAAVRQKAEVIDLQIPDILEDPPTLDGLEIGDAVAAFLVVGVCDGDRSAMLFKSGIELQKAGLSEQETLSVLVANPYAMGVALDHRENDNERATLYLWRHHVLKAKPLAKVTTADDFDVVGSPSDSSPRGLVRDKKGILSTINNLLIALRAPGFCGASIRLDDFRCSILIKDDAGTRIISDEDLVHIRAALETQGFYPIGRELMRDAVALVARENRFDSAIEWINELEWDGMPRVDSFLADFYGVTPGSYATAVSRYLWSALAGRVLVPGVKADMVPVLIGLQGSGKSTGIRVMAPNADYFTEISLGQSEDNLSRQMRGKLIGELAELKGLHSRDAEHIKAFVTKTHEEWTPKYKEHAVRMPRRLVFIGTTNQSEFLSDETGNRRWLPVECGTVDVEGIEAARLQLWAEGAALFNSEGVQWAEAERLAEGRHADHMITPALHDEITHWLETMDGLTGEFPRDRESLSVREVAVEGLRLDVGRLPKATEMAIGKVLRALGYEKRRPSQQGSRGYRYYKT